MNQPAARIEIAPQVPEAAVQALEAIVDPEIPVLTIRDLGILRGARMDGETLVVTITPTYSGCPAMVEIRDSIHQALLDAGIDDHRVETTLSPAWTTDWMSEEGKQKLLDYGIAPPQRVGPGPGQSLRDFRGGGQGPNEHTSSRKRGGQGPNEHTSSRKRGGKADTLSGTHPLVTCPQCGSENTRLVSAFGSTACKALYKCSDCQEPFDHFKCH